MQIYSFRDEFFFLSNMYPTDIKYKGEVFDSVEHGYQYHKTESPKEQRNVLKSKTPKDAKKVSKGFKFVREDWKDVRLNIMYNLLWIKFSNPELKEALLLTDGYELVEGNNWGDEFWGVCDGIGENYLGKLLMKIRNQLK